MSSSIPSRFVSSPAKTSSESPSTDNENEMAADMVSGNCDTSKSSASRILEKLAAIKMETNCSMETIRRFSQLLRELGINFPKSAENILGTDTTVYSRDDFVHLGLKEIRPVHEKKDGMALLVWFNSGLMVA